jgi:hypothetical protein
MAPWEARLADTTCLLTCAGAQGGTLAGSACHTYKLAAGRCMRSTNKSCTQGASSSLPVSALHCQGAAAVHAVHNSSAAGEGFPALPVCLWVHRCCWQYMPLCKLTVSSAGCLLQKVATVSGALPGASVLLPSKSGMQYICTHCCPTYAALRGRAGFLRLARAAPVLTDC